MVRDADQVPELQGADAGLLLHFAQGGDGDVLAGLLVAFREVPEAAAADQQAVAPAVPDQSAGGVDFPEFGAEACVHPFRVRIRDVDALERLRTFEHPDQGVEVDPRAGVEFDGVRVRENRLPGAADGDEALFKINLVHYGHDFC